MSGTVITIYTYAAANQWDTAQQRSTTWQYEYDGNGSLISDGTKTYAYDSANRLIQVNRQSLVTNLSYNGLGQRLNMDAASVIAHYVMDGDHLSPQTPKATPPIISMVLARSVKRPRHGIPPCWMARILRTSYLTTVVRSLSAPVYPWDDTLDTYGTGNFTFGYFGGVMDAATGLIVRG